jgi:hypothetical protein
LRYKHLAHAGSAISIDSKKELVPSNAHIQARFLFNKKFNMLMY